MKQTIRVVITLLIILIPLGIASGCNREIKNWKTVEWIQIADPNELTKVAFTLTTDMDKGTKCEIYLSDYKWSRITVKYTYYTGEFSKNTIQFEIPREMLLKMRWLEQ